MPVGFDRRKNGEWFELGDLAEAKDRLRVLRADRERVAGDLARTRVQLPSAEELMPRLREKLGEIEATLRADVTMSRLTLGALLGGRRSGSTGTFSWPVKMPSVRLGAI